MSQRTGSGVRLLQAIMLKSLVISDDSENSATFRCLQLFPWDSDALNTLWSGEHSGSFATKWKKVVEKWASVVAVGGGRKLRLLLIRHGSPPLSLFSFDLPDDRSDIRCIAWCLVKDDDNIHPLVAFSGSRIIYVLNVEKMECYGAMRGHGGKINALAVYPINPSMLVSASHDNSCRIYDLQQSLQCHVHNSHWPGWNTSYGGPAFGLSSNDGEGFGHGRCIAVLAGGHSGGHRAPVLGVALHPTLPLLATCGMDHAIKIWKLPRNSDNSICREDKPLFSSTRIHSAQVLSIAWVGHDMLLSNSGPIITREHSRIERHIGTIVLWRWLGIVRFSPFIQGFTNQYHARGCASDYLESSSFKIISEYRLPPPIQQTQTHVFQFQGHQSFILFISRGEIHLTTLATFASRQRRSFPFPTELEDRSDGELDEQRQDSCLGREECATIGFENFVPQAGSSRTVPDTFQDGSSTLMSCAMGENGKLLIGVGEKESIWIWRIEDQ